MREFAVILAGGSGSRMRGSVSDKVLVPLLGKPVIMHSFGAFVESGRGAVNTYRGFFNLLRIDFTFVDDRFEVLSFDSPREGSSDHYPVVSRIRLRDK